MEPVFVIAFATESVGGAVVFAVLVAAWGERAEVQQQGPASQAAFGGGLVTVEAATRVHQAAEAVHRTVHRVAGAATAGMGVSHRVFLDLVSQLGHHLTDGGGPGLRLAPLLELVHQAVELLDGRGAVHVPHAAVQFVVFAAAVANLQETVQEAQHHDDPGKQGSKGVLSRRPAVCVF